MGCICNEIMGKGAPLVTTRIGHLWMFENLQKAELEALVVTAQRRRFKRGQAISMQGTACTDFNSTDMLTRLYMAAAPAMVNSIKNKNITSMGTIFPKITRILLLKNEIVGYRKDGCDRQPFEENVHFIP